MSYSHHPDALPHRLLKPTTYNWAGDIVHLLPHQVIPGTHEPIAVAPKPLGNDDLRAPEEPVTGQDITERGLVIQPHEGIAHGEPTAEHHPAEAEEGAHPAEQVAPAQDDTQT